MWCLPLRDATAPFEREERMREAMPEAVQPLLVDHGQEASHRGGFGRVRACAKNEPRRSEESSSHAR